MSKNNSDTLSRVLIGRVFAPGDFKANYSKKKRKEVMKKMAKGGPKGFAAMDPDRRRAIASTGGKAAHLKGAAHKWNKETAQAAGKLGGKARVEKLQAAQNEQSA